MEVMDTSGICTGIMIKFATLAVIVESEGLKYGGKERGEKFFKRK